MVDTKSRGYSNSGRLSEGEYLVPFFSTRPSPSYHSHDGYMYVRMYVLKCCGVSK